MLVARRDPPFDSGAHDGVYTHVHLPRHTPRFVSALQIVGTLIGIPVGLATIYSVYHSSFTMEARCDTLRANIVSLLDKNADATTLRMLIGRDVTAFETTCGAVDPDAVKAFKHLLTVQRRPMPSPPPQAAQEPVKQVAEPVKPAPKPAAAEAKPVRLEPKAVEAKPPETRPSDATAAATATSDENWVASVRDALTRSPAHDDAGEAAATDAPTTPGAPPRVLGTLPVNKAAPAVPAPATLAAPVAPAAPALPPPVAVTVPPEPSTAAEHPVPPGSIPDAPPPAQPAETSKHSWMSKVPILNRVVGN